MRYRCPAALLLTRRFAPRSSDAASMSAKSEEFTANMPFNTQNDPFGFTDSYACEIDEKNDAKEVEPQYCDELWCDSKPDMGKESCSRLRRIMDLEEVFII